MRSNNKALALLVLPTAIRAVSLDDFKPRATQLPPACDAVYRQQIDGCSASDWTVGTSSYGCSQGCVEALQALAADVKTACANKGVSGQNIIVAFLAGQGPQSLCSNAGEYLSGSDESSSSTAGTASRTASSSVTSSTSSAETSSTPESSTSTPPSGTVTTTSLAATSLSTSLPVDGVTQSTGSPTDTSRGSSQTNMADSGGGSPFDGDGNSSSGTSLLCASLAEIIATTLLVFFTALI